MQLQYSMIFLIKNTFLKKKYITLFFVKNYEIQKNWYDVWNPKSIENNCIKTTLNAFLSKFLKQPQFKCYEKATKTNRK